MDMQLSGKVIVITGAAGGIGQALADIFAAEGARLVLTANRSFTDLEGLVVARWSGAEVLAVQGDVRRPEDMQTLMTRGVERFGRLDACVVNAGVWPLADERLDEMSTDRLKDTVAVNLLGAAWTARAFMSAMARTGPHEDGTGCSLTFIGSTAGRFGERGHSDYSITKAGLYGLVRSLKNEIVALDSRGRVNMVEPGWTATPMALKVSEPGALNRALRTMPLRQIAAADDIARAVVFLTSPLAARHVSGEILTVAGGMEGRRLWDAAEVESELARNLPT